MDTIAQNEPTGVENVAPSVDTSVNDTQPVETGDVNVTEPTETGQQSETLLAGKYKSAEELEKAYVEAQKLNGQLSQKAELANMLEKQYGMNAQQIAEYIKQQEQAAYEEQLRNDPTLLLRQENERLKAEQALMQEQAKLDAFIRANPDYEPFKEDIMEFGFLPKYQDKSYEEIAQEKFGRAIAQGQQIAYKKIDTKLMSQTTGVQSAPQKKFSAEDLKNMSTAEMEQILPRA